MNATPKPPIPRMLVATGLVALLLLPGASALQLAVRPHQTALYNVDGNEDYLLVFQDDPSASFTLFVTGPKGQEMPPATIAGAVTNVSLAPLNGTLASGAWLLRDDHAAFPGFQVEVHITNPFGQDRAQPCQGGRTSVGQHPQAYLHTVVWEEGLDTCLVQAVPR